MTERAMEQLRAGVKRYVTLTAGWTLVTAGAVLLFLPGPGLLVLLGGLALLGRESEWARRIQHGIARRFAAFRSRRAAPLDARNAGE